MGCWMWTVIRLRTLEFLIPTLQQEKFDPDFIYIKKGGVPEFGYQ